jgi:hypothetical protein
VLLGTVSVIRTSLNNCTVMGFDASWAVSATGRMAMLVFAQTA